MKRKDNPEQPKPAGRRLDWPTLWHKAQLAFPWGAPTRLRKSAKTPAVKAMREERAP